MNNNPWALFTEKLAEITSKLLTDDETDRVLSRLPAENSFAQHLKKHSSTNLARLLQEAARHRPHCKHKGTCTHNALRGLIKTFVVGFGVKYVVSILPAVLTGRAFRKPGVLVRAFNKDTIRFALFLALFSSGYKAANCSLRKVRGKEDGLNAFIAGALAGTALLIDEPSRRLSIALYLSTRAAEFAYVFAMKRRMVPNVPHADVILMSLTAAQILRSFLAEPDTLPKSYLSFLLVHGGLAKHGPIGRKVLDGIASLTKEQDVNLSQFQSVLKDYPIPVDQLQRMPHAAQVHAFEHPTTLNCTKGHGIFFLESIPRSLKLYLPLNIAMTLAFRWRHLLSHPGDVILRIVKGSLRSTLFLSLYCTIAWAVPCHLRNLFGRDEWYYVNGLLAGTAVAVESKPRRLELAMYCAPRALESLWFTMERNGYVKSIKNGEVIYFSLAMGALMSIYQHEPECLNGAFRAVMAPFFGVN